MWKRHLDIVLDPTHNPQKTKITQHFRPPTTTTTSRQKKKRKAPAFPKKKATPKKKRKIQSTLISFNPPPVTIVEPPNVQIDEAIIIAGIRRSERIRNGTLPPHNPPNKKKKVQKKKTKPTPKPTVKPSSKLRSYQEKLHAFFATKNQNPPQPNSHTQSQESPPELSAPLHPKNHHVKHRLQPPSHFMKCLQIPIHESHQHRQPNSARIKKVENIPLQTSSPTY